MTVRLAFACGDIDRASPAPSVSVWLAPLSVITVFVPAADRIAGAIRDDRIAVAVRGDRVAIANRGDRIARRRQRSRSHPAPLTVRAGICLRDVDRAAGTKRVGLAGAAVADRGVRAAGDRVPGNRRY